MSTAPILRPYQHKLVDDTRAAIARGLRRLLLMLPTGGGKTVVIAAIIALAIARGKRCLFLAHRRELVTQASLKLFDAGVDAGTLAAGFLSRPEQAVQVASIATLHARAIRAGSIELPSADVVVIDEAHHCRARSWRAIIDAYPDAIILGLTATPCRGDGRGLGGIFETLVEGPTIAELIADGFLVPTLTYAPARPDLSEVRVSHGDFVEADLDRVMNQNRLVGDIVEHWMRLGKQRATVVFASGVAHSVHIRDEFRRAGVVAEHLDGSTPGDERDAILRRLADGSVDLVSNAAVLTEGWDSPSVSCVVLARPTKSLSLYRQMVGRVLRPAPGKTDALVIDHAGAVFAHGFIEDPITWTLREDRRAENLKQKSRDDGEAPKLVECPECRAVRLQGQRCPTCGWRPQPRGNEIKIVQGDLAAVARDWRQAPSFTDDEKISFYRQLLGVAKQRGYQRGWAAHKFKERFGAWPPRGNVAPLEPDAATLRWVKSRQIAYAKAVAKQRGAV
jgi:DNA repair protein RadD